jgi:hypothetical protein
MAESTDAHIPAIPVPPAAVEPMPVVAAAPAAAPAESVATPAPASPYGQQSPTAAQYAPPAYAPPAYVPAAAAPAQGLSIASMICGISGLLLTLFSFGFLPALAAVITGHIAAKNQPWARGMWVTGLITGYIGLAINVLIGIFVVIFFGAMLFGIAAVDSY